MRERDYGSYVEDIIEYMSYAEEFIKSMSFEEFANDKKTVLSVTKCIEIVGEATKRIPDSITHSLIQPERCSDHGFCRHPGCKQQNIYLKIKNIYF